MADVVGSARALMAEQVEVARLEARTEIAHVLRAVTLGSFALVATTIGMVMGGIAAMRALSSLIPQPASMAIIATICGAAGIGLFLRARRELPRQTGAPDPVPGLPDAASPDIKALSSGPSAP